MSVDQLSQTAPRVPTMVITTRLSELGTLMQELQASSLLKARRLSGESDIPDSCTYR
jgi:hypothetical protein